MNLHTLVWNEGLVVLFFFIKKKRINTKIWIKASLDIFFFNVLLILKYILKQTYTAIWKIYPLRQKETLNSNQKDFKVHGKATYEKGVESLWWRRNIGPTYTIKTKLHKSSPYKEDKEGRQQTKRWDWELKSLVNSQHWYGHITSKKNPDFTTKIYVTIIINCSSS